MRKCALLCKNTICKGMWIFFKHIMHTYEKSSHKAALSLNIKFLLCVLSKCI